MVDRCPLYKGLQPSRAQYNSQLSQLYLSTKPKKTVIAGYRSEFSTPKNWIVNAFFVGSPSHSFRPTNFKGSIIQVNPSVLVGAPKHHPLPQQLHRIGRIGIEILQRCNGIPGAVPVEHLLTTVKVLGMASCWAENHV